MATCSATPTDLVLTEAALMVRPLMSTTAATNLFGPERDASTKSAFSLLLFNSSDSLAVTVPPAYLGGGSSLCSVRFCILLLGGPFRGDGKRGSTSHGERLQPAARRRPRLAGLERGEIPQVHVESTFHFSFLSPLSNDKGCLVLLFAGFVSSRVGLAGEFAPNLARVSLLRVLGPTVVAHVDQWSGADVRTMTNSGALAAHFDLLLVEVAPDYCLADSDVAWDISVKENDDGAGFLYALDSANRGVPLVYDEPCELGVTDVARDVADHSLNIVAFGSGVHRYFVLFAIDANALESQDLASVVFFFGAHHNDVLHDVGADQIGGGLDCGDPGRREDGGGNAVATCFAQIQTVSGPDDNLPMRRR
ncbi:hypothetical protein MTO96_024512 [Rhipicephalus appendiculatus]